LENEVRLLRVELERKERALEEAGAAQAVLAGRASPRVLPAETSPLAGASDLVLRVAIDRGSREGVVRGQPVLSGGGLAGIVLTVGSTRSEVRLVTDPLFRLRASAARPGIEGLLEGTGGPLLIFRPAPGTGHDPALELAPGDALVASRSSTLCDLQAVVGVVRSIERAPGEPTSRALVEPAVEVSRLERVLVVIDSGAVARAEPK
jgi:rod shape-determining protein MreC